MSAIKRTATIALTTLAAAAALAGCSVKGQTQFQDAKRTGVVNTAPADLVNMPDGYSNMATKCDHGNRIYSLFHGDGSYGSVFVVAHDPTCNNHP